MRRPLVWLTAFLSLGILVASKTRFSFPLAYALLAILLIVSFLFLKKQGLFSIFIFCLVFFIGVALLKNAQNLSRCHISKFIYYKNNPSCVIKGVIDNQPQLKKEKTSFIFKTQTIQTGNLSHTCCGNILVYLKTKEELNYGEDLVLRGHIYRPFGRKDHRRQSYRDYLSGQGIWFIMVVKTPADIVRLNSNHGFFLKRFAFGLKQKIEGIISRHTSSLTAAILGAMILGEKRNIPAFLNHAMMQSGTVHILVVSGFNVGIVSTILFLFLKLLRLSKKARLIITIPLLIIYCLMTGASTPVVRATVMAIVFILGLLIKRQPDIYNSLSLAALFILVVNPRQLFDIGFQLSFLSVIFIVYFYPKIKSLLRLESLKPRFISFILNNLTVSFSAWLGTLVCIAYNFKIFSPVTVLANLFIVPLASLITLCGFSLILMGYFLPSLAYPFALSCEFLANLLVNINTLLIRIPAAYFYF